MDLIYDCFHYLYLIRPSTDGLLIIDGNHRICALETIMAVDIRVCEAAGWQFEPHGPMLDDLIWL